MPVVCHICGREFGTASINLHVPRCEQKWEARQARLPADQRRPPPSRPAILEKISKGDFDSSQERKALKEYNEKAFDDFNKQVLEPCPNCKRTFRPEALTVHLRSCKAKEEHERTSKKNVNVRRHLPTLKRRTTTKETNNTENNRSRPDESINNNEQDEEGEPTRSKLASLIMNDVTALKSLEKRLRLLAFIEEMEQK